MSHYQILEDWIVGWELYSQLGNGVLVIRKMEDGYVKGKSQNIGDNFRFVLSCCFENFLIDVGNAPVRKACADVRTKLSVIKIMRCHLFYI